MSVDRSMAATPLAPNEETSPSAELFGPYVLRTTLASGGMGSVHLATTVADGEMRVVAVKRLHPHLAGDASFAAMFLDEARIQARISHPNVCSVLGFGSVEGVQYLTLEYLRGEPLRDVLAKRNELPLAEQPRIDRILVQLVADACDGLHAAHELRDDEGRSLEVVHRDVSPHNLVVTYDGVLKIIDFGVARAAERAHHTRTGTVKGKFAYMAPEQMRGAIVDRRADVWGLGVILWESLVGRPLFRKWSDGETVLAVMSQPIPNVRELRPDVSETRAAIVAGALSRDRDARPPTARALGEALRRWLAATGAAVSSEEIAAFLRTVFAERYALKSQNVERLLVRRPLPRSDVTIEVDGVSRSAVLPSLRPPRRRTRRGLTFALAALALVGVIGVTLPREIPGVESGTSSGDPDGPPTRGPKIPREMTNDAGPMELPLADGGTSAPSEPSPVDEDAGSDDRDGAALDAGSPEEDGGMVAPIETGPPCRPRPNKPC